MTYKVELLYVDVSTLWANAELIGLTLLWLSVLAECDL